LLVKSNFISISDGQKELNTSRTVGICMTKRFNLAWIDSTNTIICAKSLLKKVGYYYCLNCNIYYNPRFKLYSIGKTSKKKEVIANAA
jgi:hypothetical protein